MTTTSTSNGTPSPVDPSAQAQDAKLRRFEEMVANISTLRREVLTALLDPRRDILEECGYPTDGAPVSIEIYRRLYERDSIAARVVEVLPAESWQVQPTVYEDEDADSETPFEKALAELNQGLLGEANYYKDNEGATLWHYLRRLDVLAGIGTFGVMLLGIADGKMPWEPAAGAPPDGMPVGDKDKSSGSPISPVSPVPFYGAVGTDAQYGGVQMAPATAPAVRGKQAPPRLLFLRVFDESLVQIVQYEGDMLNPRFGQPVMYLVTLNDPRHAHSGVGLPLATVRVHWSRIHHVADDLKTSEVWSFSRLQQALNDILGLRKLRCGAPEMYWKGAFPGISLETHPQLGGDVAIDQVGLKGLMEDYMNGLQRYLALTGMSAKTLAPTVADPSAQIDKGIEAICIKLGVPVRVFKGSERGELASSQDDAAWNDRLRARQRDHITPKIIVPLINRLIMLGILPEPEEFHVDWPDLDSQTDAGKAAIAVQKTQALAAYVAGNVESLMPPLEFLTLVLGMEEKEAQQCLDAAQAAEEQQQADAADLADQHGFEPAPPPGYTHPQPPQQTDPSQLTDVSANFNPSHDPQTGQFSSGDGGGGDAVTDEAAPKKGGIAGLFSRHGGPIEHVQGADSLNRRLAGSKEYAAESAKHEQRNAHHYAALAEREGTTVEGIQQRITQRVQRLADSMDQYIRAPLSTFPKILQSGRFKTQFETGASRGVVALKARAQAERDTMGVPEHIQAQYRPVSTYLSAKGFANAGSEFAGRYGGVMMRLKDSVRGRSTATLGDSLEMGSQHRAVTTPLNSMSHHSVDPGELQRHGMDLIKDEKSYHEHKPFIEGQVHGGLHVHDIAEVAFPHTHPPSQEVQAALAHHGIGWRTYHSDDSTFNRLLENAMAETITAVFADPDQEFLLLETGDRNGLRYGRLYNRQARRLYSEQPLDTIARMMLGTDFQPYSDPLPPDVVSALRQAGLTLPDTPS